MASFKTRDGKTVEDGKRVTLTLQHGEGTARAYKRTDVPADEVVPHERKVTGTVRAFDQDGETRWEISTGNPDWPAIGFLPENVISRSGS